MPALSSWLDAETFAKLRQERGLTWGRPLRLHESATSTNDLAWEAAELGMKTGGVFVAREQTRGRGRGGHSWQAPPGENLTFSVLLRLPRTRGDLTFYPLAVGLAVADAASSRLRAAALIKWPNDILVNGKKVSGILVESRIAPEETTLVVGIGLNVQTLEFPPELPRAGSLAQMAWPGADLSLPSLLVDLLGALERRTATFLRGGMKALHHDLMALDALRGQKISVENHRGIASGIAPDGALLLDPEGGGPMVTIRSGSVEWLP